MDLKNKNLDEWLKNPPKRLFPQNKVIDYYSSYAKVKEYLKKEVHKHITIGANLKNRKILLNDHGEDHIEMVIDRASKMVASKGCALTPKEVFLLLVAIQLHDVGNIFGRYKHERNSGKIWKKVESLISEDTTELFVVRKIAEAHGGKYKTSKDTIGNTLSEKQPILNEHVRARLLAAILRFSDELADDNTRTSKFLQEGLLPKESEIYHRYSSSLHSVLINHEAKAIELHYNINEKFAKKKYGKYKHPTQYILDEIYERTMKMHLERTYCMRYMKEFIQLERISINIDFFANHLDTQVHKPITYELENRGYPDLSKDIFEMCPQLIVRGKKVNGLYIRKKLRK